MVRAGYRQLHVGTPAWYTEVSSWETSWAYKTIGIALHGPRLSYFLCAKCSRIIILINALMFVPFSSASFFNSSKCFGDKNVVILSVLAIGLGDNVPPPFIFALYYNKMYMSMIFYEIFCVYGGHVRNIVVFCIRRG